MQPVSRRRRRGLGKALSVGLPKIRRSRAKDKPLRPMRVAPSVATIVLEPTNTGGER
jgi:hypothetical protein